ncbi:MAG: ATP-binding protein [Acidobacteriota bacterium]
MHAQADAAPPVDPSLGEAVRSHYPATARRRTLVLTLRNRMEELTPACRQLCDFLADRGLSARTLYAADLVAGEMMSNAIRHAYPKDGTVRMEVELGEECVMLTFTDRGQPFDPTDPPEASRPTPLRDTLDGGLGLRMVHHTASALYYRRIGRENRTLVIIQR